MSEELTKHYAKIQTKRWKAVDEGRRLEIQKDEKREYPYPSHGSQTRKI